MYNFCAIPCGMNDKLCLESGQNVIFSKKQLPSPNFESSCSYKVEDGRGRQEEDLDISLSRLGQNPEILLFPIPRQ
jgi:hypothetical protein